MENANLRRILAPKAGAIVVKGGPTLLSAFRESD